eukprot:CAMPEP_0172356374 /NCGR_PEP_ID=MMETSP1060-20121228/719_1 /TAXON_ID=37318 /ORGANISM="Pseudo-nitzschia pungens, Strain cf. cingulata" /LENGTH=57 /DNA_ID=CAMNT_0013076423 /DNA_START=48 /DNA_END=221 /DNA_ORIENTATION=-
MVNIEAVDAKIPATGGGYTISVDRRWQCLQFGTQDRTGTGTGTWSINVEQNRSSKNL